MRDLGWALQSYSETCLDGNDAVDDIINPALP